MANVHPCVKGDCLAIIAKFLDPLDIINLYKAFPKRWETIWPVYRLRVGTKIDDWFKEQFKDRYHAFRKAMIKTKAVLSGSFILQIMLWEPWSDSDIDIFLPNKELVDGYWPAFTDLHAELYTRAEQNPASKYMGRCGTSSDGAYDETLGKNAFTRIYEYRVTDSVNKQIKFQVMDLNLDKNRKAVIAFIKDNFDFDFCKNVFYYEKDGFHLDVVAPLDIVHKRSVFAYRNNKKSSLKRCEKYIDRGFKFEDELGCSFDPRKKSFFNKLL